MVSNLRYEDVRLSFSYSQSLSETRVIASISPTLQQHVTNMLSPTKKTHVSCLGLLADITDVNDGATQQGRTRAQSIALSGPKTPRASAANNYSSSPEQEYFLAPSRTRHASRWKEDWEELEMLVKLLFSSSCSCSRWVRISGQRRIRISCQSSQQNRLQDLCRCASRAMYFAIFVPLTRSLINAVYSQENQTSDKPE